jgi:hypothetical protein
VPCRSGPERDAAANPSPGVGSVAVQGGSEVMDEGIRGVVSEARALSAAAGCPRGRGAPIVEDLMP